MKSNMCVDVEFLAGTSIGDAISEAKYKCFLWSVAYVKFNFNGVSVSIQENCDIDKTAEKVMEALRSDKKYVVGIR